MTFLERAMENNPSMAKELILDSYCPHHLHLEMFRDDCDNNCEACWNREMPEKTVVAHLGPFDDIEDSITTKKIEELKEEEQKIIEKFNELPYEYAILKEDIPKILDSGNRREFETGAVRDIQEGKGRCDLLPLDVVGFYYAGHEDLKEYDCPQAWVFYHLTRFKEDGMITHLFNAIHTSEIFPDRETMFLEVAKHFEEGCKKYGENNWQKGIPVHCYIDSAVRHYLKYLRGDKDEPHDRAFIWNLMCAIWTCNHMPELNDYAKNG